MLSSRLLAIASMIPRKEVVADIGTDHALLPIYLVEQGICFKVYAVDNKDGPLTRAKVAIQEANLQHQIIPILSDGLQAVPDDATVIVIAGMGVDTAKQILMDARDRWPSISSIVLQLNGDQRELRTFLMEQQWIIDDEVSAMDQYVSFVLRVSKSEHPISYSYEQLWFGPHLLERKDPLLVQYIQNMCQKKEQLLLKVNPQHIRYAQLKDEIALCQKVLTGC